MNTLWPALLALMPAILGPLPEGQKRLIAQTCWGEPIEIPLGDAPQELPENCHQQGCHGRCSRGDGEDGE